MNAAVMLLVAALAWGCPMFVQTGGFETVDFAWRFGRLFAPPFPGIGRTSAFGAHSGSWAAQLRENDLNPTSSFAYQILSPAPDWASSSYTSSVWVKKQDAGDTPLFMFLNIDSDDGFGASPVGVIVTDTSIDLWSFTGPSGSSPTLVSSTPADPSDWIEVTWTTTVTNPVEWNIPPTGDSEFKAMVGLVPFGSYSRTVGTKWLIDDVDVQLAQEDLMARSNMGQFLTNLCGVIEGLDPNIGKVFKAERRWSSDQQLRDDGAIIFVDTAGLWDGVEHAGHATRFWILEPWIQASHNTNCTTLHRGQVRIVGFYGYNADESSATILRQVAEEIIDALTLKSTETTDLAASMGDGYMGYLQDLPGMLGPVRSARLLSGPEGHLVTIAASYFEEVSRT